MMLKRLRRTLCIGLAVAALTLTASASANAEGTITWGKPTEVVSFDPHLSGDGASWAVFYLIYDQLLSLGDDYDIAPGLAEKWEEISPTSYRFHLRKNAAFSNGRPVTAADVVGSFERLTHPETGGVWGKQLGEIEAIVAEDDHTVRFDLAHPNGAFLNVLSVATTSILPMKELNEGTFDPTKELLGSGPFMVEEHVQDQHWKLVRNSHYYRDGHPIIDELMIRILPDDSARIAALRTGSVDIAQFSSPDTPQLLENIPNVKVVTQHTPNYFRLDVSAKEDDSPFADKRVRQAMHYALDRERIAEIVFGGQATVEYPVPSVLGLDVCRDDPFYTTPRPERLDKARALLREAGMEGVEVGVIGSSALSIYPLIAQVIQSSLNEAGFNAKVENIPTADWYNRVFVEKTDFDLAVSWYAGYSDPAMVLYWWTPEGAKGWADGYTVFDDRLTAAINEIRQSSKGPDRRAAMNQACKLINENANVLALVSKPDYIAYRDDLISARIETKEGNFNMLKYADEFSRKE
jgi:peptide/nickel transport system substrate-binding protein